MSNRKEYIGSSEIAAVMGLSRWLTPLKLWAIKTGEIDAEKEETSYMEWGKRLECIVAEKFSEKNGVKLIAYKKRFTHKLYHYLTCELDRIIAGTDEIVEVKTASAYKLKEWATNDDNNDIPIEYTLQVMFALGLSGRKIGHIAVLVGGNTYLEKKITFDKELFEQIVEKAKNFWENHVLTKIPPVAISADNEIMVELFPKDSKPEYIQAAEEFNTLIALRQEINGHITEMMKEKDDVEAKIKLVIGENSGVITDKYIVSWKQQSSAPRYFKEKMKEDGVYGKYSEETVKRVLRITRKGDK